ncbi:MAG: hypothetical protein LBP67_06200 [Bacteroidales bacterium]|nr:hypothetical protein [Bacteroidales bacterium]
MYIENNGNVGLGTLSPTKKLDVNGDIKGSQLTLSGLSSNSGRIIKIGTGGLLTSSSISETSEGNIKIAGANNESKNLEVTGDISSNNITISSLNLNKSQVLKVGNDNKITTAVIYEYGGNVGIGQYATDPQEKLQIGDEWTFHDGTGDKTIGRNVRYAPMNPNSCYRIKDGFVSRINFTVMGGILLQVGDNNSAGTSVNQWHGISLVNNGYVGVATADPQEQFQIGDEWTFHNGDTKYIGRNIRNNGTDDVKIKQGVSNTLNFSSTGISLYTYDEGAAGSIVNRTGNITLLNNGNVGIGFISPTKKLQVNGDIYSSRDIWGEKIFANDGIGINTSTLPSGYKLAVNGKIICTEMKVKPFANWSDYVFEDNYKLKTLKEVEAFISENKHLPDVPSAKEVKENGIDIGEMQKILLQKIEELTLYTIEQQKQIMELNEQIKILQQLNNKKGGE